MAAMGFGIHRQTGLWRLILAFVVLVATTLQVVPRPCAGHGPGAVCPASVAAQCSCSCCTTHVAGGRQPTAEAEGPVYYERLCGADGHHALRAIPLASRSPVGHVSLPSWRVPGLWQAPDIVLTAVRPPIEAPHRRIGHPRRVAISRLRPPNA